MTSLHMTHADVEATSFPPHPFTVRQPAMLRQAVAAETPETFSLGETEARWMIAIGGAVASAIMGALCGAALAL